MLVLSCASSSTLVGEETSTTVFTPSAAMASRSASSLSQVNQPKGKNGRPFSGLGQGRRGNRIVATSVPWCNPLAVRLRPGFPAKPRPLETRQRDCRVRMDLIVGGADVQTTVRGISRTAPQATQERRDQPLGPLVHIARLVKRPIVRRVNTSRRRLSLRGFQGVPGGASPSSNPRASHGLRHRLSRRSRSRKPRIWRTS